MSDAPGGLAVSWLYCMVGTALKCEERTGLARCLVAILVGTALKFEERTGLAPCLMAILVGTALKCEGRTGWAHCLVTIIVMIIILLKQDYKIQLASNKIQMAWLTSWLVVG